MPKMRLRPGLHPGPRWGSLQCSPDFLAGFQGPTSKGRKGNGAEGTGEGKRREEGRAGKGRGEKERKGGEGKGKERERSKEEGKGGREMVIPVLLRHLLASPCRVPCSRLRVTSRAADILDQL